MRYLAPLGIVSTALLLNACATTPQGRSTLPPGAAVTQGMNELFRQPSYRVHSEFRMKPEFRQMASIPTIASEDPAQAAARENALKMEQGINQGLGAMFTRTDFTVDAVLDLRHRQVELQPSINYKAVNAGAYVRVPALLDFGNSQGYVDLSALSPFLAQVSNDGKLSHFSMSEVTDIVDLPRFFTALRDITQDSVRNLDPNDFHDAPLQAGDAARGGVRRVREVATFKEVIEARRTAIKAHADELKAGFKLPSNAAGAARAEKIADTVIRKIIENEMPVMQKSMTGTVDADFLLDSSGRFLESDYHIVLDDNGKPFDKLAVNVSIRFSEYGNAHISITPTAANTVALADNTKGTLMELFGHKPMTPPTPGFSGGFGPGHKAGPTANNPLAGHWKLALSERCARTYYIANNYTAFVTSGKDISYLFYSLSPTVDEQGYYALTERVINDNGEKDCNDQTTARGATSRFVRLAADGASAQVCTDEKATHCLLMSKLPDEAP